MIFFWFRRLSIPFIKKIKDCNWWQLTWGWMHWSCSELCQLHWCGCRQKCRIMFYLDDFSVASAQLNQLKIWVGWWWCCHSSQLKKPDLVKQYGRSQNNMTFGVPREAAEDTKEAERKSSPKVGIGASKENISMAQWLINYILGKLASDLFFLSLVDGIPNHRHWPKRIHWNWMKVENSPVF